MKVQKYLSPETLAFARKLFACAYTASDEKLVGFIFGIIVKPAIIAFLIGFCTAMIICIELR